MTHRNNSESWPDLNTLHKIQRLISIQLWPLQHSRILQLHVLNAFTQRSFTRARLISEASFCEVVVTNSEFQEEKKGEQSNNCICRLGRWRNEKRHTWLAFHSQASASYSRTLLSKKKNSPRETWFLPLGLPCPWLLMMCCHLAHASRKFSSYAFGSTAS